MSENRTCPCCGRHCDLRDPHCKRGREYAKKGIIRDAKKESKNKKTEPAIQYDKLDRDSRLVMNLRESGYTVRYLFEGKGSQKKVFLRLKESGGGTQLTGEGRKQANRVTAKLQKRHSELFSGLADQEKELLLSLLEKLNKEWANRNMINRR